MRKKVGRAANGDSVPRWSSRENRYVVEISLGRDDRGKRVRKRLVGPRGDKSEDANYGLKDRAKQAQRRNPPVKRGQVHSRLSLGEYLETWMTTKRNALSEKSFMDYEGAIRNHIKPGLGNVRLRDLERGQIRAFFGKLPTLGDGGKAKVYTVLRAALNDAALEHDPPLLAQNVAARLRLEKTPSSKRKQTARADFWTTEEMTKFLRVATTSPYYPMFLTMLSGALGQAEVFALRWENIDLKSGVTSIVADLIEVEGRLVYRETKTEFRRRSFKLPPDPLRALRAMHKKLSPRQSDFVFQAPQGGPIRRTTFGARVWQPLILKAEVPRITPHKLRDNAGSFLTAQGIPPGVVHRILGHSDFRTTANKYLHLFDESRDEEAAAFDKLFKSI